MVHVTVIVIARLQSKPNKLKEIDMEYFMIYLLTQLDSFRRAIDTFSTLLLVVTILILFLSFFVSYDDVKTPYYEYLKTYRLKLFAILFCVFYSIGTLIPSTKQAAFIYIMPHIIANGDVKDSIKALPELAKLGTEYLKTMLKDKIEESKN